MAYLAAVEKCLSYLLAQDGKQVAVAVRSGMTDECLSPRESR